MSKFKITKKITLNISTSFFHEVMQKGHFINSNETKNFKHKKIKTI